MLYREYPLEVRGEVAAKNVPVLALCSKNGSEVDIVDLGEYDRVFEDEDKGPFEESLADYALRCQNVFEFFETWKAEVEAAAATKSGHRAQPLLQPSASQTG